MKIGLYDVDSYENTGFPNLALMKISQWHKTQGHQVEHYMPLFHQSYDQVYASKVFQYSSGAMITDDMITGGTGLSMEGKLPDYIDQLDPDYSLYDYPHNLGFLMRGCRFKCDFCVVPKKEGKARSDATIDDIWTQRSSNFIVLLDNDFFGNPHWKERIEEINAYKLRVNFSQGLNIRIISERQAAALASTDFRNRTGEYKAIHFAWDNINDERTIRRGIKRVVDAGIKARYMTFYVLIGFNSTHEEDMHRIQTIDGLGADPFVMPYNKKDPRQRKLARWVNNKHIFHSSSWDDFTKHAFKERVAA